MPDQNRIRSALYQWANEVAQSRPGEFNRAAIDQNMGRALNQPMFQDLRRLARGDFSDAEIASSGLPKPLIEGLQQKAFDYVSNSEQALQHLYDRMDGLNTAQMESGLAHINDRMDATVQSVDRFINQTRGMSVAPVGDGLSIPIDHRRNRQFNWQSPLSGQMSSYEDGSQRAVSPNEAIRNLFGEVGKKDTNVNMVPIGETVDQFGIPVYRFAERPIGTDQKRSAPDLSDPTGLTYYDLSYEATTGAYLWGQANSTSRYTINPSVKTEWARPDGAYQNELHIADNGYHGVAQNFNRLLTDPNWRGHQYGYDEAEGGGSLFNVATGTHQELYDKSAYFSVANHLGSGFINRRSPEDLERIAKQVSAFTGEVYSPSSLGGTALINQSRRMQNDRLAMEINGQQAKIFTGSGKDNRRAGYRGGSSGVGPAAGLTYNDPHADSDGLFTSRVTQTGLPFDRQQRLQGGFFSDRAAFGEGETKVLAGQNVINRMKSIELTGYNIDNLPFMPGDVFTSSGKAPSSIMEGSIFRGGLEKGSIPGLESINFGNSEQVRVQDVTKDPLTGKLIGNFVLASTADIGEIKPTSGLKGSNVGVTSGDPHFNAMSGRGAHFAAPIPSKDHRFADVASAMFGSLDDPMVIAEYMERAGLGMTGEDGKARYTQQDIHNMIRFTDRKGNALDRRGSFDKIFGVQYDQEATPIFAQAALNWANDNLQTVPIRGTRLSDENYQAWMNENKDLNVTRHNVVRDPRGNVLYHELDYETEALMGPMMGDWLPKNISGQGTVKPDYMNVMNQLHPKAFEHLMGLMDKGGFRTTGAAKMFEALRANDYSAGHLSPAAISARNQMEQVNVMDLDFAGMESAVRAEFDGLTDDQVQQMVLSRMASQYKGQFVNMGSVMGIPLDVLANQYSIKDGQRVGDFAHNAYQAMRGYQTAYSLREELLNEGNMAGALGQSEALFSAHNSYLYNLSEEVIKEGVASSAMELKFSAPGGPARMIGGLPENMKVMNDADVISMIKDNFGSALSKEEMAEAVEQFRSGNMYGMSVMSSANRGTMWHGSRYVSAEWLRGDALREAGFFDQYNNAVTDISDPAQRLAKAKEILGGMAGDNKALQRYMGAFDEFGADFFGGWGDLQITPGTVGTSEAYIRMMNKDADGDNEATNIMIPGMTPDMIGKIRSVPDRIRAMWSVGDEAGSSFKKFGKTASKMLSSAQGIIDSFLSGVIPDESITPSGLFASEIEGARATSGMERSYGSFGKGLFNSTKLFSNILGVDPSQGDILDRAGMVGNSIYQPYMDMEDIGSLSAESIMASRYGLTAQGLKNNQGRWIGGMAPKFLQSGGSNQGVFSNKTDLSDVLFDMLVTTGMKSPGKREGGDAALYTGKGRYDFEGTVPTKGVANAMASVLARSGDIGNEEVETRIYNALVELYESGADAGFKSDAGAEGNMSIVGLDKDARKKMLQAITGEVYEDDLSYQTALRKYTLGTGGIIDGKNMDADSGVHNMSAGTFWLASTVAKNTYNQKDKLAAKGQTDNFDISRAMGEKGSRHFETLAKYGRAMDASHTDVHNVRYGVNNALKNITKLAHQAFGDTFSGFGRVAERIFGSTMPTVHDDPFMQYKESTDVLRALMEGEEIDYKEDGGELSDNITIVGEEGPEIIVGGKHVLPNEVYKQLFGDATPQALKGQTKGLNYAADGTDLQDFFDSFELPEINIKGTVPDEVMLAGQIASIFDNRLKSVQLQSTDDGRAFASLHKAEDGGPMVQARNDISKMSASAQKLHRANAARAFNIDVDDVTDQHLSMFSTLHEYSHISDQWDSSKEEIQASRAIGQQVKEELNAKVRSGEITLEQAQQMYQALPMERMANMLPRQMIQKAVDMGIDLGVSHNIEQTKVAPRISDKPKRKTTRNVDKNLAAWKSVTATNPSAADMGRPPIDTGRSAPPGIFTDFKEPPPPPADISQLEPPPGLVNATPSAPPKALADNPPPAISQQQAPPPEIIQKPPAPQENLTPAVAEFLENHGATKADLDRFMGTTDYDGRNLRRQGLSEQFASYLEAGDPYDRGVVPDQPSDVLKRPSLKEGGWTDTQIAARRELNEGRVGVPSDWQYSDEIDEQTGMAKRDVWKTWQGVRQSMLSERDPEKFNETWDGVGPSMKLPTRQQASNQRSGRKQREARQANNMRQGRGRHDNGSGAPPGQPPGTGASTGDPNWNNVGSININNIEAFGKKDLFALGSAAREIDELVELSRSGAIESGDTGFAKRLSKAANTIDTMLDRFNQADAVGNATVGMEAHEEIRLRDLVETLQTAGGSSFSSEEGQKAVARARKRLAEGRRVQQGQDAFDPLSIGKINAAKRLGGAQGQYSGYESLDNIIMQLENLDESTAPDMKSTALWEADRIMTAHKTLIGAELPSHIDPEKLARVTELSDVRKGEGFTKVSPLKGQEFFTENLGAEASLQVVKEFMGQIRELGTVVPETANEMKEFIGTFQSAAKAHQEYTQEVQSLEKLMMTSEGLSAEQESRYKELMSDENVSTMAQVEGIVTDKDVQQKALEAERRLQFDKFSGMSREEQDDLFMAMTEARGYTGRRRRRTKEYDVLAERFISDRLGEDTMLGKLFRGQGLDTSGEKGTFARGALEAFGEGSRLVNSSQAMMFTAMMAGNQIWSPLAQTADKYQQAAASRDMMLLRTGAAGDFDQILSSEYGDLRRKQARGELATELAGQSIYNTFSGFMPAGAAGTFAPGAGSTAASVGSGVMAGMLGKAAFNSGGAGLGIGLAAYGLATASQTAHAYGDVEARGSQLYRLNQARNNDNPFAGVLLGAMEVGSNVGVALANVGAQFDEEKSQEAFDYMTMMERADIALAQQGMTPEQFIDINNSPQAAGVLFKQFRQKAAEKYGTTQEQAESAFQFSLNYGLYAGNTTGEAAPMDIAERMNRGFTYGMDYSQLAMQMAAGQGKLASDQFAVGTSFTRIDEIMANSSNPSMTAFQVQNSLGLTGQMNQALAMANMGTLDSMHYTEAGGGAAIANDRFAQSADVNQRMALAGVGMTSSSYANVIGTDYTDFQKGLVEGGNYQFSSEYAQRMQMGAGLYDSYRSYGASDESAVTIAESFNSLAQALDKPEFDQFVAALSGDIFATQALADERVAAGQMDAQTYAMYNRLDPTTGRSAYASNISAFELQGLQAFDPNAGLRFASVGQQAGMIDISGGTEALAGRQRDMQYGLFQGQREFSRDMSLAGYLFNTGGADWINRNGSGSFRSALSGAMDGQSAESLGEAFDRLTDSIDPAADGFEKFNEIFEKYGYQAGSTRGIWQIEDEQIAMRREMQGLDAAQSVRGLALEDQSRQMRYRQFYEQLGLQKEQFQFGVGRQRTEMGENRQMQLTQQGWQYEDWSFGRSKMDLGFGWQMEDFNRNLRYARGRDRVDMLRQQERSVINYSMDASKSDRDRDRLDTTVEFEDRRFDRMVEYFEKETEFQQRSIDMREKHFLEQFALEDQQFQMRQERHALELEQMYQTWALEDERREKDREWYQFQFENAEKMSELSFESGDEIQKINMTMQALGTSAQNADAQLQVAMKTGKAFFDLLPQITQGMTQVVSNTGEAAQQMTNVSGQAINTTFAQLTSAIKTFTTSVTSAASTIQSVNFSPSQTNTIVKNSSTTMSGAGLTTPTYTSPYQEPTYTSPYQAPTSISSTKSYNTQMMYKYAEGGYIEGVAANITPFRGGGYTGDGRKYESAGVDLMELHKGEYVVPQDGALVLRGGDSMTVEELKQIRMLMQKLVDMGIYSVNATIYSDQSRIKANEVNPIDSIYQVS